MRAATALGLLVLLVAAPARAERRGTGTRDADSTTPPPSEYPPARLESTVAPARDLPAIPRHGMMGSPGAAQDALGPSRLGPHGEQPSRPSWGEAAPGTGQSYARWHAGDRVRSASSADVRAARQQQAPDLEWASGGDAPTRLEPQRPFGVKDQGQSSRSRKP